jgi:hypothetical protein
MRNGTLKLRLGAAICTVLILAACNAQPTASRASAGEAAARSNDSSDQLSGGSSTSGSGVAAAPGEATVAGDTTGRGGVFVGSGH